MANYKKKTIKTSSPKKNKTGGKKLNSFSTAKTSKQDDIKMSSSKSNKRVKTAQKARPVNKKRYGGSLNVISGGKAKMQRKKMVSYIVVAALALCVLLFCVLTPTGPFEYIENKVHTIGAGNFPVSISGSELYEAYDNGSIIYSLSDTHAEIINHSGKTIFSRQHDFNSPMMSTSSQRALVYDAGGKNVYVYNYKNVVDKIETEHEIYCADISRNGTIAIASKSTGYATQVEVISKSGKVKFVWYSANEIINNVALSNNGKRLAVSTVNASGGSYKSKVYVFKYSNAEPVHTFSYDGAVVYSLNTLSASRFSVVTDNTIDFIKWRGGARTECPNTYTLNAYRTFGKTSVAVSGNKSNNKITVYGSSGKVLNNFDFLGAVTDIYYYEGRVFVLSDGYLYSLDKNGKTVFDKVNLSGYSKIFASDANTIIAVGNFGFDKFNLK